MCNHVNKNAQLTYINLIQYAFKSQALAHGLDPTSAILELHPREGEHILREEDILKVLEEQGASIALVIFSGVQYYTGQLFPMEPVTRMAKEKVYKTSFSLPSKVLGF